MAPAAHGGTRTGRAFTGDKSGDFLFKCLFKAKISNQPYSENLNDGLKLKSTYVTNILKCVPPGDKPTREELNNCSYFLKNEMGIINNIKVILCLGKIAFDSILQYYKTSNTIDLKSFKGSGSLLPKRINSQHIKSIAIVAYGREHSVRLDVSEIKFY